MMVRCYSGRETAFDGAEQCEQARVMDEPSCDLVDTCTISADLGSGVTASQIIQTDIATCYAGSDTQFACHCQVGGYSRQMVLARTTAAEACDIMFDTCDGTTELTLSPLEDCSS